MARPRKIENAEELSQHIDEFIKKCDAGEIESPTDYRLAQFLGISVDTLYRYYTDGRDDEDRVIYKGFGKPLKKLIAYREDRLCRMMEANPRLVTPAIIQLKQNKNGGYTDKQVAESNGTMALNVSISGASGAAFEDPAKTDK